MGQAGSTSQVIGSDMKSAKLLVLPPAGFEVVSAVATSVGAGGGAQLGGTFLVGNTEMRREAHCLLLFIRILVSSHASITQSHAITRNLVACDCV